MAGHSSLRAPKNNKAKAPVAVKGKSHLPRQPDSAKTRQAKGRTRITNGSQLLPNVDHRNMWVRRFKDILTLHGSDLGGSETLSEAEKSIIRRASCITIELEQLERKFALNGEATPLQLAEYGRAANTLRRLLESVGLKRRQRNITPTLSEYLNNRNIDADNVVEADIMDDVEAAE